MLIAHHSGECFVADLVAGQGRRAKRDRLQGHAGEIKCRKFRGVITTSLDSRSIARARGTADRVCIDALSHCLVERGHATKGSEQADEAFERAHGRMRMRRRRRRHLCHQSSIALISFVASSLDT